MALRRELTEECGATPLEVCGKVGEVVEVFRPQETEYDAFHMTSRHYVCRWGATSASSNWRTTRRSWD
ncbi:hypothetical protein [Deinococcus sp. SYSU M49105]|uniref:hypothetical protein n=1 Tax=Deinococcus aestuarii TaxID=2774531 RepID=UPI001C0C4F83